MSSSISDLIGAFDANLNKYAPGPLTVDQAMGVKDTAYSLPSSAVSKQEFPSLTTEPKPAGYNFTEYKEKSGWEKAFTALDDFAWQFARKPAAQVIGSVGLLLQATRQFSNGEKNIDLGGDVWDLWTGEDRIDVGTSISFLVGQSIGLVGDALTPPLLDNAFASTISQDKRSMASGIIRDWGMGTLSADFDLFSEEDRSYLSGGKGVNAGTVFTQGLNFSSDLLLDPINLVPFAKVGKLLYGSRQLLSKAGALSDRFMDYGDDLVKISKGEAPKSAGTLRFLEGLVETKNVNQILGLSSFRASTDANIGSVAVLAANIDNVKDMADLFLAVEFKSTRALANLAESTFAKPGMAGVENLYMLDNVFGNGGITARRQAAGIYDLGTIDNPAYTQINLRLIEELEKTPEGIALVGTTFGRIGRNEADELTFSASVAPVVGLAPSKIKVVNDAEILLSKFRGYNVYGNTKLGESATIFASAARPVVQWMQYARASAIKNFIDVNNTDMQYMPKITSMLEAADKASKGALTRAGLREQYARDAALATEPQQRGQIVKDLQKDLFNFMAEAQGVDPEKAKVLFDDLMTAQSRFSQSLRETGTAIVPDGNGQVSIVDKAYLSRQTDNFVDVLDFAKLPAAIRNAKPMINSMAFTSLADGSRKLVSGVQASQAIWSSLVVTRPARLAREFMQNSLIFGLSGYGFEAWFARNGNKEIGKHLSYNIKAALSRGQDYALVVGGKRNNAENLLASARVAEKTAKEVEQVLRRFDEEQLAVWSASPLNDYEPDMLRELIETQAEMTSTVVYHGSLRGLDMQLNPNKVMTAFTDQRNASTFVNDNIPVVKQDFRSVRAALTQAADTGAKVEVRAAGDTWRRMSPSEMDSFMEMGQKALQSFYIRVIPTDFSVSTRRLSVYGDEISLSHFAKLPDDLKDLLGLKSQQDLKAYVASGAWKDDTRLLQYGRKNLIGRYDVAEAGVPGGRTTILVPDFVVHGGKAGRDKALANVIRVRLERLIAASDNPGALGELLATIRSKGITKTELEEILSGSLANLRKSDGTAVSLLDGLSNKQIAEAQKKIFDMRNQIAHPLRPDYMLPGEDLPVRIRAARQHLESIKSTARDLNARATARVEFESSAASVRKQRAGQGFIEVRGNLVPDFGQGADGRIASTGLATGNTDLTRSEHALSQSRHKVVEAEVKPTDPEYFDSVVDKINTNFRAPDSTALDPVVAMVLKNRDKMSADEVVQMTGSWIRTTPEGRQYARQLNLDPKNADDWATMVAFNVNRHVPTEAIASKLLNNEELTVAFFRSELEQNPELMLPMIGRMMDKKQALGGFASAQEVFSIANKVLADMPTEAFFANPLAVAAYQRNLENRIAAYQKVTGQAAVPAYKMEEMVLQARRGARAEVRKYVYNTVGSTNLTESLRIAIPFITAQIFTLKAMTRASFNNPASAAWMLYMYNKAITSMPWVDENGDPTKDYAKAKGILLPMDPWIRDNILAKIPVVGDALADSQNVLLSKVSMDAVFQGNSVSVGGMNIPNPFMPGFGPFVSMPVSQALRSDPNNELLNWIATDLKVLPFGPTSNPLDEIVPGMTIGTIKDMILQQGSWMQAYNENIALAAARLATGQIDEMPTDKELKDATNKEMWLKTGLAFFSPVSTKVETEYTVAKNRFDSYTEKYGYDEGIKRFKIENPDLIFATVGTSQNKYDLRHSAVTVENLKKNPDLVAAIASLPDDAASILGWAVNPEEPQVFDSAAYAWAMNTKLPGLNVDENYLRKMTPEEVKNSVLLGYALNDQARQFDAIDALAQERGTTPETDKYLEDLQVQVRKSLRNNKQYGAAYTEHLQASQGKFDNAANAFEVVFTNAQWMAENGDKPVVSSIATFLAARNQVKGVLLSINDAGGKGTLGANPQIRDAFYSLVNELKAKDLAFAEAYNRYFVGDRIV